MKKNSKKVLIMGILVVIMIVVVTGVSLAFFNYTRTGTANTLSVGRISFNHTQDGKIELNNVFPADKNNLNSINSDTVTINITGDTTYSEGIEYKVTLEDVNNTINGKEVPISIRATATNLGTEDSNYYTNRENKTNIYKLNSEGDAYNGKYIAVGYIPSGSTGVNGSIDITAFIDTNKVAITDTYLNETTDDWVMGREVFTTSEWNSFSSTPLSFKVKVEANEGIWVEAEKFLTMKNLNSIQAWKDIRFRITSIEFHKDGIAPVSYETSFDVTDESSDPDKGTITLYTVDDGINPDYNVNMYKVIIVANDIIYAPQNSSSLFSSTNFVTNFNSNNFKVDNVTNMNNMFNSSGLSNLDSLLRWNTSNVTGMTMMFTNCTNLTDISGLANWNVESVTSMQSMFTKTHISNLNSLSKWNVANLIRFNLMFNECLNLIDATGINNWDISSSASFTKMFQNTPVHPEFTKFPNGTWDSNGTFTPNA